MESCPSSLCTLVFILVSLSTPAIALSDPPHGATTLPLIFQILRGKGCRSSLFTDSTSVDMSAPLGNNHHHHRPPPHHQYVPDTFPVTPRAHKEQGSISRSTWIESASRFPADTSQGDALPPCFSSFCQQASFSQPI